MMNRRLFQVALATLALALLGTACAPTAPPTPTARPTSPPAPTDTPVPPTPTPVPPTATPTTVPPTPTEAAPEAIGPGELLWMFETEAIFGAFTKSLMGPTSAAIADGVIYFGGFDGNLYAVD